uniref:Uncharacterized protein n=1 Tax=Tetranychus urticae TaxID=32264 RepID=T1KJX1_TETUR
MIMMAHDVDGDDNKRVTSITYVGGDDDDELVEDKEKKIWNHEKK